MPPKKHIRKAVLPIAGLGTRFLPATKSMPKEMLPVVDKPLIQYAIEEAKEAGIEEICFVTGRGKDSLIDYFDIAYELETILRHRHKEEALEILKETSLPPGSFMAVRQQEPLGLGHAVWCARAFIGDDPFAVLLPDDLIQAHPGCLKQMVQRWEQIGGNMIATMEVPPEQTDRYGILDPKKRIGDLVEINNLIEKPDPKNAPSRLSVIGRYILDPVVLQPLEKKQKGAGGEIQLTDAIATTINTIPFHGLLYHGKRYDCGNKLGYLQAQIAFALKRPDLKEGMKNILENCKESIHEEK